VSLDLRSLVDRMQRWSWLVARVILFSAAALMLVGGVLASVADRALSDAVVVAAFFLAFPGLALAWLGLPFAHQLPDPEEFPS